jgi:hypothetical protein
MPVIAIAGIAIVIVLAAVSLADNGNGMYNWFHDDVESNTDVAPGCDPQKYLVRVNGDIFIVNDFIAEGFDMRYEVNLIDSQIADISIDRSLAWFGLADEFRAKVCLYDTLNDNKKIKCKTYDELIRKGDMEKRLPFEFTYNLYDNDCNGEVDDHTLLLVTELWGPDGYQKQEKTIGIIGGEPVYQNAKI